MLKRRASRYAATVHSLPAAPWVTLEELAADPHPTLSRLRTEHPVAWVPALNGWLVTTRALVLDAMRDDVRLTVDDPRFSTGQITGPSMLSTDGSEHARHRAPFARPFRLDAVRQRFADACAAQADQLVAGFALAGEAELRTQLAGPLAARLMLIALGFETASEQDVLAWYVEIVDAVSRISAGQAAPPAGFAAYDRLGQAIRESLDNPGPEPSLLAAALGDATELSEAELIANAAVLLFGGIETTEGMIANLLHHLLTTPDVLAALADDPLLLEGAIEESLRLEPAAAILDRYATCDLTLGGVAIPAGDLVILSMAAANRDTTVFSDPDRFDPTRANARLHTTFATGSHVCLGMHLARAEAAAAVRALTRRLPTLRADPARPSSPRGLVFRKPPAVWALWG